MRDVTVGVVGLGYGQRVLVPAFRAHPRCTVTALCASRLEHAQRVAERLGVPGAYGDWRQLVADPDIRAIAVATPPAIQPAIVNAALACRKHVFCEKPLATTRQAAAEMLEAARQAGVAHMVDFEFPMLEEWQRAKVLLQTGALGQVRHGVVCWQFETYVNRAGLETWKTRTDEGGGAVNLFASHTLYYLEWLLGPIQSLWARLFAPNDQSRATGAETLALICLTLRHGTPVSITLSNNALLGTGHRVELYGEQGSLVLENPTPDYMQGFRLLFGRRAEERLAVVDVPPVTHTQGDSRIPAVARLVERFVDWIEQGIPSTPTIEHGYRVQCLLEAVHQAHHLGSWVDIVEEEAVVGK